MDTPFDNTYDLTLEQLENLDLAEDMMLRNNLGAAEKLLLEMLSEDEECIPVLSNLGHLYGRHYSYFGRLFKESLSVPGHHHYLPIRPRKKVPFQT